MSIISILKRLPPYALTAIVVLAVLYFTLMPEPLPDNDIQLFPGADKVVHGIMMMAVTGCLGLDYLRKNPKCKKAPGVLLLIFCIVTIAFGGAIELIQGAMAMGRGEDINDFYADAAGAVAGFIISYLLWVRANYWLFKDLRS